MSVESVQFWQLDYWRALWFSSTLLQRCGLPMHNAKTNWSRCYSPFPTKISTRTFEKRMMRTRKAFSRPDFEMSQIVVWLLRMTVTTSMTFFKEYIRPNRVTCSILYFSNHSSPGPTLLRRCAALWKIDFANRKTHHWPGIWFHFGEGAST